MRFIYSYGAVVQNRATKRIGTIRGVELGGYLIAVKGEENLAWWPRNAFQSVSRGKVTGVHSLTGLLRAVSTGHGGKGLVDAEWQAMPEKIRGIAYRTGYVVKQGDAVDHCYYYRITRKGKAVIG